MGGRGATASFTGGGGGAVDVTNSASLVSARNEGKQSEVDKALTVLRDVNERYGLDVEDALIATLAAKDAGVMAYYDSNGNLAINRAYFDDAKMNAAYDKAVADGFHPSRGDRSAIEAVTAHEMGHRITEEIGVRMGLGAWGIDEASDRIIASAASSLRMKSPGRLIAQLGGYSRHSAAEALAEAFSDVYCNGRNASRYSHAIVNAMNAYF